MENNNLQQRFRDTSHGPRATNRPYASFAATSPRSFRREASPQKNAAATEKSLTKAESLKNFRDLKVWQLAKEIAVIVYRITQRFPQEELYGLSSQMRRAAISVSSNIAEGFNRFYKKDYQRFLMISLGSCGELESQTEVGIALGYITHEGLGDFLEKLNHENRMLHKLHSKLGEEQRPRAPQNMAPGSVSPANDPAPLRY